MKRLSMLFITFMVIVNFLGCAATPKEPISDEIRKKIKTIAVVQLSEPEQYLLDPGRLPGGQAFYLLGALGGLVIGGIEAARANSATQEFTQAVAPYAPNLGEAWNESITQLLMERGYAVRLIPTLPKGDAPDTFDCSQILGQQDAVLASEMSAGYAVRSKVEPQVVININLLSGECSDSLLSEKYVYSDRDVWQLTLIERDPQFSYPDRSGLIADPKMAASGMRAGVVEISKRVASGF